MGNRKDLNAIKALMYKTINTAAYRTGKELKRCSIGVDGELLKKLKIDLPDMAELFDALEQDRRYAGTVTLLRSPGLRPVPQKIFMERTAIIELAKDLNLPEPLTYQNELISSCKMFRAANTVPWLDAYYEKCEDQLGNGSVSDALQRFAENKSFYRCLNAIASNTDPVSLRGFSTKIFGNSKSFEAIMTEILTILRNYSPVDLTDLTDDEVLFEFNIRVHTLTLSVKGPARYTLDGGETEIDCSSHIYGEVINSNALRNGNLVSYGDIKRVVTIENKTVYEEQPYDPECLYIYSAGYLSPSAIRFLRPDILPANVQCYHWGDMDYGGIRIFEYLRTNMFNRLLPYKMSAEDLEFLDKNGKTLELKAETAAKLVKLDTILTDLKEKILETGKTAEQESYLL